MTAERDEGLFYGVEISGWNSTENFFVEQAFLEWNSGGLKSVHVKADLRAGTIVFLRLLERGPLENQMPIAYQATDLGPRGRDGRTKVCLQQMRPREKRQPETQQGLAGAGLLASV